MRQQETITFQKISIRHKLKAPKHDDWKRDRKAMRKAKRIMQEKIYA